MKPGSLIPVRYCGHDVTSSRSLRARCLLIALVLLPAVVGEILAGGAWNRKVDGYYIKLGPTFLSADHEFDLAGERREVFNDPQQFRNGAFGITNLGFYGELGLTDWLTGILSTQYTVAVREADLVGGTDTSQSSSGLGDTWLSARLRLLPTEGTFVAALTAGVKVPTGSPNQEIPLGTGVLDYETSIAVGSGFPVSGGIYGYAQASGGYRFRGKASDEFTYQIEAGVNLTTTFLLQGTVDGIYSTADFDTAVNPVDGSAGAFVSDQTFVRWNLGAIYAASDDMDVNIGYGHVASGRNTLDAGSFSIGLSWKR